MFREEIDRLRKTLRGTHSLEVTVYMYACSIFMALALSAGLVYFFAPIDLLFKHILFLIMTTIVLTLATFIYLHNRKQSESHDVESQKSSEPKPEGKQVSDQLIPPKPTEPPSISVEAEPESTYVDEEDFEMAEDTKFEAKRDNPSLYRHSFSIIPVIFKIALTGLAWLVLLVVAIVQGNMSVWWIFIVFTPSALIFCYYIALRWNGEEFVVNDEWYERPLTMPFPFQSKTPAIRRSEVGMYEIRQTSLDKIIKTCRLYSDTHVKGDEKFHNVKWLTHPAELRRATGISAPRKNSYLFMTRKQRKK